MKDKDGGDRSKARRENDAKKAAWKKATKGSILPPGHQRGKGGRTKGSGG